MAEQKKQTLRLTEETGRNGGTMLYGHSQNLAAALPLIQATRPAFWVAIDPDPAAASECMALGVKLIVRHNIGVPATAREYVDSARRQSWFPSAWAVTTPNEPWPFFALPGWYPAWEAECVRLLSADGKECIVANMGTHQPLHVVPGARYYGIHAYWGTLQGWPDIEGFWATVLAQQPGARFLMTEMGFTDACGRDVPPGEDYDYGWRAHLSAAAYAAELGNMDARLSRLRGYQGGAIFQLGANPDWQKFESLGVPEVEALIIRQGQEHERVEEGPMADNLALGPGMAAKAAQLGVAVTGRQLTGERYLGNDPNTQISYAVFERGKMEYYAGTGLTAFIPFR